MFPRSRIYFIDIIPVRRLVVYCRYSDEKLVVLITLVLILLSQMFLLILLCSQFLSTVYDHVAPPNVTASFMLVVHSS
jgi:hypothetical protein